MLATVKDFEDYFDAIIKKIIDECVVEVHFSGCLVRNDYYRQAITVEVPLSIPENKAFVVDSLKARIIQSIPLDGSLPVHLPVSSVHVNVLVNLLPVVDNVEIKIKESEDKNMFVPEVKKIIHRTSNRGEFFTVVWRDNTTTTVKLMEGEDSDDYTAFLYALGKKMFGDKGKGRAFVREKKEVFEEEVRQKSKEKQALRRRQAIQQSIDRECEDLSDLGEEVYGAMFVAPALIPKKMFKKNRGNE